MKDGFEFLRGLANCQDKEQMQRYIESHRLQLMTNGDWIRGMSDKELAEFVGHICLCSRIQEEKNGWCASRAVCENCVEEWLQQPVGEENAD